MKTRRKWVSFSGAVAFLSAFLLAGCGSDGDSALSNGNPGLNDVNVVAAFGDSITLGNQCDCPAYPTRMGTLTG